MKTLKNFAAKALVVAVVAAVAGLGAVVTGGNPVAVCGLSAAVAVWLTA